MACACNHEAVARRVYKAFNVKLTTSRSETASRVSGTRVTCLPTPVTARGPATLQSMAGFICNETEPQNLGQGWNLLKDECPRIQGVGVLFLLSFKAGLLLERWAPEKSGGW